METLEMIDCNFWLGKKVFLTGHTGFKGSWASIWLHSMGANVRGYSLPPTTHPNLYEIAKIESLADTQLADIRHRDVLINSVQEFQPDVVLHMAAQPLVRYSYKEPIETFETNAIGTMNMLEAIRSCPSVTAALMVTTDKCYDNKEWFWGYRETEAMGGKDPYSASKACAELIVNAYRSSYFDSSSSSSIATARAGNVIGGGDWSDDRLIPDILKAIETNESVLIRNPESIRPWQHVIEPVAGYLTLLENLSSHGNEFEGAWNFGPADTNAKSVRWIVEAMINLWESQSSWNISEGDHPHEAHFLKLDSSKAGALLNWKGKWDLHRSLKATIDWQKNWLDGNDAGEFCLQQIEDYLSTE